jgi:lipoic acid synthetase
MEEKTNTREIDTSGAAADKVKRRPSWLKARIPGGEKYAWVKSIITSRQLHTVCAEARCPNIGECWNHGTATFMILGDACTRNCGFCAVMTGKPKEVDHGEPHRVAEAVRAMEIRHAVITSVTRDDLSDGGALIFAETIRQIRATSPATRIEVLIPDFKGDEYALNVVLDAKPDVLNHNLETVPRLYGLVRPQASYARSLAVLDKSKRRGFTTKTGLMVGIGESPEEIMAVMIDGRMVGCDILTIGQYLQPTKEHLPVDRFVHPDEFKTYGEKGIQMGFKFVESGPLVRSSYHAGDQI